VPELLDALPAIREQSVNPSEDDRSPETLQAAALDFRGFVVGEQGRHAGNLGGSKAKV
jgi:hypothetical protein